MKDKNIVKTEVIDFFKQENKPKTIVYFKNAIDYKSKFYFEDLFKLLEMSNFRSEIKYSPDVGLNYKDVFSHVFEIFNVRRHPKINLIHNQLSEIFNKHFEDDGFRPDIFTSFKGNIGNTHVDNEDVFIFGLYGTVYYNIPSENNIYEIKESDALYIPRRTPHAAHSFNKRIVVSWSRFL